MGHDGVVRVPDEHEGGHVPLAGPHGIRGDVSVVGDLHRGRLRVLEGPHGKAICRPRIAFDADVRRFVYEEISVPGATAKEGKVQSRTRPGEPLEVMPEFARYRFPEVGYAIHRARYRESVAWSKCDGKLTARHWTYQNGEPRTLLQ